MSDKTIDFDPYELLGVGYEAEEKELIKAYRKMALKWHPDKNKDSKEYAEKMFHKITKALEILTDAPARAALDKLRKAKEAAQIRFNHLDSKRQKLRADLERREAEAAERKTKIDEAELQRQFEKEVERLRKQASELMQRERDQVEKEVHKTDPTPSSSTTQEPIEDHHSRCIRVTWTGVPSEKDKEVNDHYTEDDLKEIFEKWGSVLDVLSTIKAKKNRGTAIVEFERRREAISAYRHEHGRSFMPLTIKLMTPETDTETKTPSTAYTPKSTFSPIPTTIASTAAKMAPNSNNPVELNYSEDFESMILQRMKLAQQKKKQEESKKSTVKQQEIPCEVID